MAGIETLLLLPIFAFIALIALQQDKKKGYYALLIGTTALCFLFALNFLGKYNTTGDPVYSNNLIALGVYFAMGVFSISIFGVSEKFSIRFDGNLWQIIGFNIVLIALLIANFFIRALIGFGTIILFKVGSIAGAIELATTLIIAPILEEIFFRGIMNPFITNQFKGTRFFGNKVFSSLILGFINTFIIVLIFVFAHGWYTDINGYIGLIILSVVTTFMVNETNDVRASIPFHMAWNVLALTGIGVII